MQTKACELSWIVVSDLNKAKKFFTETMGMKVVNEALEWGGSNFLVRKGGCA